MRHYSVLGDIHENSELSLAILCIDSSFEELINKVQDTNKFVFMYLPKNELDRFNFHVMQNESELHIGSLILFENINSAKYTIVDCSDISQHELVQIFDYMQSLKENEKFNVINPLKKKNTVRNICSWIQENHIQLNIMNGVLKNIDDANTTKYYALDNEERELLIKLLAKADVNDIDIGIADIKERRQRLIEDYRKNGELNKAEELQREIDDLVILRNEIFISNQYINVDDELNNYSFLYNFNGKSKKLIKSCLTSEYALRGRVDKDFDYTLCASGYWRAIEIELNLVIVDGLRYYRRVINELPSNNVSLFNGAVEEKIGTRYDYKSHEIVNVTENINRKGAGSILKSVMFGGLTGLSKHYSENNVLKIYDKVHEINPNLELYSKLGIFLNNLENKIYELRNRCSHQGIMNESEFLELKSILFDSDYGVFKIISEIKKSIYSSEFTDIRED